MAQGHLWITLSLAMIALLIVVTKCYSHPLFSELPVLDRSNKFHTQQELDRDVNRLRQYYATMAKLKFWRRDLEDSDQDDDNERFRDLLLQRYKALYDEH